MKKIIPILFSMLLINSIAFSASNPATDPTQRIPKYVVSPEIVYYDEDAPDSFVISPRRVETEEAIAFKLRLVGRDNLEVDLYYVLPGVVLPEDVRPTDALPEGAFFLIRLNNDGGGLYSGTYRVPEVPPGIYTDFHAVAHNDEDTELLFSSSTPGIQVVPTPELSLKLRPTEVKIGDSLLFTADVIGQIPETDAFDATSVEIFYRGISDSLLSLTEQKSSPAEKQIFKGEFPIPSGIPKGDYNQFFAVATYTNGSTLEEDIVQTVNLNTSCATVNVTVSDTSSEEPLPGATITVAEKTATTDASGQASITQLIDNTEQMLFVTAPDFLPLVPPKLIKLNCLTEVNETVALEPTIKGCAQLNVTVVDDSESVLPISGASVSVASHSETTDGNGEATFKELIEGSQTINVSADDFFLADPKEVELSCDAVTSETISLTSKECATLQVKVVNDSGEGIPDADVSIASKTDSTDIEGLVTFEKILEGTHTVNVTASGFRADEKAVELLCDTPVSESFILDICAEVDVIVSGSDGARLSGAAVNISGFSATTSENGVASFTQLDPGFHNYQVSKLGIEPVTGTFPLQECRTSPDEVFPPLEVTLDTDCATVNINVVDSSEGSQPVPGATIEIAGKTAITDALGQASITQLPDNTQQALTVSAPDFLSPEPKLVQLSCLTEVNETIILEPVIKDCAIAQVKVVNDSGEGIPNAEVSIASITGFTDSEGLVTLQNILEGTHPVNVSASGYGFPIGEFPPGGFPSAELTCDNENIIPNIIMDICVEVNVFVSEIDDGEKFPLSGATVNISGFSATTDSFGNAKFTQLNPGNHDYQVSSPGLESESGSIDGLTCRINPNFVRPLEEVVLFPPFPNNF